MLFSGSYWRSEYGILTAYSEVRMSPLGQLVWVSSTRRGVFFVRDLSDVRSTMEGLNFDDDLHTGLERVGSALKRIYSNFTSSFQGLYVLRDSWSSSSDCVRISEAKTSCSSHSQELHGPYRDRGRLINTLPGARGPFLFLTLPPSHYFPHPSCSENVARHCSRRQCIYRYRV